MLMSFFSILLEEVVTENLRRSAEGKTQAAPCGFCLGHRRTVAHGRDEKVAKPDGARTIPPPSRVSLCFTTLELLAPAQLLVLMLAHFFTAFFQHTGHAFALLRDAECRSFLLK